MQKEIFEQPNIISNSLSRFLDPINKKINIPELKIKWKKIKRIDLIACGTSFFASQIATYWFENYIGIPSSAHLASEYRYKRAQKLVCLFPFLFLNQEKPQIHYTRHSKTKILS